MLMNCTNDANPDAWFPESPQGNQSITKLKEIGAETSRAINLCNSCPSKAACLSEGMKPGNLAYGIWGGKLAGERIAFADVEGMDYMVKPEDARKKKVRVPTDTTNPSRSVIFEEKDKLTKEERKMAVNFYNRITPFLEVSNV